jgi:hypothetical protein
MYAIDEKEALNMFLTRVMLWVGVMLVVLGSVRVRIACILTKFGKKRMH